LDGSLYKRSSEGFFGPAFVVALAVILAKGYQQEGDERRGDGALV
jgi:hypothetical protein